MTKIIEGVYFVGANTTSVQTLVNDFIAPILQRCSSPLVVLRTLQILENMCANDSYVVDSVQTELAKPSSIEVLMFNLERFIHETAIVDVSFSLLHVATRKLSREYCGTGVPSILSTKRYVDIVARSLKTLTRSEMCFGQFVEVLIFLLLDDSQDEAFKSRNSFWFSLNTEFVEELLTFSDIAELDYYSQEFYPVVLKTLRESMEGDGLSLFC